MKISQAFTFEAAHRLPNVPREHRCHRMHGHSYRVEIRVEGPVDPRTGFVIDFFDLEAAFSPLPERTRAVLELYYRRGLEPAEIGETLGMDRNAVYQRLHQGHTKLREAFRDVR